jgi:MFS family permease
MLTTYVAGLLYMTAYHMVTPLIPIYAKALGATPLQVGLVLSSHVVLSVFLCVHLGAWADAAGAGRLARAASLVFAAGLAALALSRNLWMLAAALSVFGFADIAMVIATQTSVAALSTPEARPQRFATLTLWNSAGLLIGPIVGGAVAARWGYRVAFATGVGVAGALVLAAWLIPRLPGTRGGTAVMRTYRRSAALLRDRWTTLVVVASFATMFALSLRSSFFPIYLTGAGLSTTAIGALLSTHAAASMAVRPALGAIVAHTGEIRLFGLAIASMVAALAGVPLFRAFWPQAVIMAALGTASGVVNPLRLSLGTAKVSQDAYGAVFSLQITAMQLSQLIAPTAYGLAAGTFGPGAPFLVGAVVAACGLGAVAGLARAQRPVSAV